MQKLDLSLHKQSLVFGYPDGKIKAVFNDV